MTNKVKQLVAEIFGDGKLFNEGLDEEHLRGDGSQMRRERETEPREVHRTDETSEGVVDAGARETPTN